jgi:hypothetical protein
MPVVPVIDEPVIAPQYKDTLAGAVVPPISKVARARVAPAFIVIAPLIVVRSSLNVVVPAEIIRLLKLLNVNIFGRVLLAPKTTVPVPRVQVCVPVPGAVSVPLIVNVPPDVIVIVEAALLVLFPIAKLLHVKFDPFWNVIVPRAAAEDVAPT